MELRRVAVLDQIDRLTNDPLSEHSEDVQKLKSAYNRIVKNIRNEGSAGLKDILDIFPSEVWIQIVKDALPVRGYGFALLLLTMVSNKCMQTLISVPTFWANIELQGSQEDSLATVEVFRQLSRDAPVHLSIYAPIRHDHSTICAILINIGPRLREVTIGPEADVWLSNGQACAVLQLLLTGSRLYSGLTYIRLEDGAGFPLYQESTSEFIKNNPLQPSLRAIHGWSFEWRDFQTKHNYLERLEAIESRAPIECVLSHRIHLPNLRSLIVDDIFEITPDDEEGFSSLQNLTSLTYSGAYREVLMRLLLRVAPQLVYLNLRVPHTKIPLLATALPVAINLRRLMLIVQRNQGEDNEQESKRDICPVYQGIPCEIHGLTSLDLSVVGYNKPATPEQAEHWGSFLSFLMSAISGLYTKVGSLRLRMFTKYPIAFDVVLPYVQSLPELRTLELEWPVGHSPGIEDKYTLKKLEYLKMVNIDVSHCFCIPNLLCLRFTWGYLRSVDAVIYTGLQRLSIDTSSSSAFKLPESSFPSLQILTIHFNTPIDDCILGGFRLASFRFLRSITIASIRVNPHRIQLQGTMLCFALLSHPSTCPSLREIEFRRCFPDWDILFLMLEKRNFMVDSGVSLIQRITIPFIPSELCAPLASLLGGIYAERPPNNDLFMGGARELLLDDQVPGCIECLLRMMSICKCPVESTKQDSTSYRDKLYGSLTGVGFAWTEIPEYGDPVTLEWMVRRNSLLEEFIVNFATWKKQYHREEKCQRKLTPVEITEDGVIARDYSYSW